MPAKHETHPEKSESLIMSRCLICGRRLSLIRRWLGLSICWRRVCKKELDAAWE